MLNGLGSISLNGGAVNEMKKLLSDLGLEKYAEKFEDDFQTLLKLDDIVLKTEIGMKLGERIKLLQKIDKLKFKSK